MKHPFTEQDYHKSCIAASCLLGYIEGIMQSDKDVCKFYPDLAIYADKVADALGLDQTRDTIITQAAKLQGEIL